MEVKLKGDFFPYSDYSNNCRNVKNCRVTVAYWTGYYSTRPRLKLLSNIVASSLRAVEILFTLGAASWLTDCSKTPESLQWAQEARMKMIWARRTWSTFQHHDGITGTSTARVMRQQTRRLKRSGRYLRDILEGLVSRFLDSIKPLSDQKIHLRESATSRKAKIVIFNPSEYDWNDLLAVQKLRDTNDLEMSDGGQSVLHQLGKKLEDKNLVYFRVPVPPLSLKIIEIVERTSNATCLQEDASIVSSKFNLSNNVMNLTFERNLLTSMTSKNYNSGLRIRIGTYDLYPGLNGAYLFKPRPKIQYLIASEDSKCDAGPIFKEVVTKFESVNLTIRLMNEEEEPIIHLFVEYLLEEENKELFLEIGAEILSDTWKTDVNGFELRERKNVKSEGLEADVYPMTCLTYLEGCEHRLAVISDHSHGVVNPREGVLQIMLDRRTTMDDGKGMGEGLMDNVRTVSSFLVVLRCAASETTNLLTLARKFTIPAVALTVRAEDLASGLQPGTAEPTTGQSPPQEGGSSNALDFTEEPFPYDEATNRCTCTSAGNNVCVSTTSKTTTAASVECEKSYSDILPSDQTIPLFVGDIAQGIRIVTLRALSDPSDWALLVLHNTLNKTAVPFPSTSTFAFIDICSIVETTLTGSIEIEQFAVLSDIVLSPNALKTVKVLLKQSC